MDYFAELDEIWKEVYASLGENLSQSTLNIWFGEIKLIYMSDSIALLSTTRQFRCEFINTKYIDYVKEGFYNCLGFDIDVDVICVEEPVKTKEQAEEVYRNYISERKQEEEVENQKELEKAITVISPDNTEGTSNYTFENFLVGDSNKFAYAACYAIATSDEVNYNPLFIHGKSGLGKTHLMYAIINQLFIHNKDLHVVYIRGEEFTNQLVEAIKSNSTEKFREKYRTADILLVDDIQFIAGKSATQDEFFHTFNALYESQKQIIVTCDRPINEIKNLEERIRTRLEWGLSADIQPPDTELRMAIIQQKAIKMKLTLPPEVIVFLSQRLSGNVRRIEGGIKKLSALHFLSGKEITLEIAKAAIKDFAPEEEPVDNKVDKVIMAVCDKFNISKDTILGKKRTGNIVTARHACMFALRENVNITLEEIGTIFSCHHTSVMSALKKVERERGEKPAYKEDLDSLIKEIKESLN